jgi:muconolactone D-isomerase
MLFKVEMTVNLPVDMPETTAQAIKGREKSYAQELQQRGKWRHLWRVSGTYSNVSIFDVNDSQELHDLVSALPLFPYMDIEVTALNRHPSSIHEDDR